MIFQPQRLQTVRPIGFLAKQTRKFASDIMGHVEEVCSVTCCISTAPRDAVSLWRHNPMGFYSSEALALGVIPPEDNRTAYDLYGYFMPPVAFDRDGEPRDLNEEENRAVFAAGNNVEVMGSDYLHLGWDIVSNSIGWINGQAFECSPLTCNGLAREIASNQQGLIDGVDRAFTAAPQIARDQPEPGTYYLVQVWRKANGLPP